MVASAYTHTHPHTHLKPTYPFLHLVYSKYETCLYHYNCHCHYHHHGVSRALFFRAYGPGKLQRGLPAWGKLDEYWIKLQAWIGILLAGRHQQGDDYCLGEAFTIYHQERFCPCVCSYGLLMLNLLPRDSLAFKQCPSLKMAHCFKSVWYLQVWPILGPTDFSPPFSPREPFWTGRGKWVNGVEGESLLSLFSSILLILLEDLSFPPGTLDYKVRKICFLPFSWPKFIFHLKQWEQNGLAICGGGGR